MESTYEDEMNFTFGNIHNWTNPPKKGVMPGGANDPILFNNLEESARSLALACIMAYGIRFDSSAISEIYGIIEEGVIEIKKQNDENAFKKICDAQKNLVDFISQIAQSANENKLTSVDDKKVKEIKKLQFCPVYPFS